MEDYGSNQKGSNNKLWLIVGGAALIIGLAVFSMWYSATNKEVTLRARVEAEQKVCKNHFDNMWKILQEQAEVSNEYRDAFEKIFPKLMEERYGDKSGRAGALLSFVKESNPNFDISLYSNLQKSIRDERTGFTAHQDKLIDVHNTHTLLLRKKPSKWFLGDVEEIKLMLITSARTNAAYETGEDNDVNLFVK